MRGTDGITSGRDVIAEQIDYYRRRAAEYDRTAYGANLAAAQTRIDRVLTSVRPNGSVLEIACGTGLWTAALARRSRSLTAVDTAPEALAIAQERVGDAPVRFVVADIFQWEPGQRFDTIFMGFWLSHVPSARWRLFFNRLRGWLVPHGRVIVVDEHIRHRAKEAYAGGDAEIVVRELADGTRHRVVKVFIEPGELHSSLSALGWRASISEDGDDWVTAVLTVHPSGGGNKPDGR